MRLMPPVTGVVLGMLCVVCIVSPWTPIQNLINPDKVTEDLTKTLLMIVGAFNILGPVALLTLSWNYAQRQKAMGVALCAAVIVIEAASIRFKMPYTNSAHLMHAVFILLGLCLVFSADSHKSEKAEAGKKN